jgi:acyl-homoserine lactone acylase PvdQ
MKKTWRAFGFTLLLTTTLVSLPSQSTSKTPETWPLAGKVIIRRDVYGIPHILAETEEAAAFGFGYAQAEDHCQTIARALVSARGEEAKYFGTGIDWRRNIILAINDLRNTL